MVFSIARDGSPVVRVLVPLLVVCTAACTRSTSDQDTSVGPLAAPTIERDAGGTVRLSTPSPNTVLRYTLDGQEPDANSGPYLAPISLAAGGRVRARTFSPDRKRSSAVVQAQFDAIEGVAPLPSTLVPCTQDRDWPIYDWAERHRATTENARRTRAELVFLGDSITQMFGGAPHDRAQPGHRVWDRYYGERAVANLGFGYDRIENVLWRLQDGAVDSIPLRAVVVNIGTNNVETNTTEEIVRGIGAILDEMHRRHPSVEIVLMGLFPRGPGPSPMRKAIDAINAELVRFDARDRVTLLDIGSRFLRPDGTLPRELMGDFLHPTELGYSIWAEALEPVLVDLLGE